MSHVAEGILHAYLDGALDALAAAGELPDGATAADVIAHLAACADCRARLEEERAVRESAGLVMGDAALRNIALPPLADMTPHARTHRRRWVPLSWAATVVLAVGAGWWGSEIWRAQGGLERMDATSDVAPLGIDRASEPGQTRSPAEARAQMAVPNDIDMIAPPVTAEVAAGTAGPPDADAARTERAEVGADAREARAGSAIAAAPPPPSPPPAALSEADRLAAREPIGTPMRDSTSNAAGRADVGAVAAEVAPLTVQRDAGAARALASATQPSPMAGQAFAEARKSVEAPIAMRVEFDSISARDRAGVIPFTPAAPSDLGGIAAQLFTIEGASLPSIEVGRMIGVNLVRVRQTLPTGEQVEVLSRREVAVELEALVVTGVPERARDRDADASERRAAAAADSAREAATRLESVVGVRRLNDGRNEVLLRSVSGDVWIAVRADLDAERLAALASRLVRPITR